MRISSKNDKSKTWQVRNMASPKMAVQKMFKKQAWKFKKYQVKYTTSSKHDKS